MALMDQIMAKARARQMRILLPEATDDRTLKAAAKAAASGLAKLILVGEEKGITLRAAELGLDLAGVDIVDPATDGHLEEYTESYFKMREKKGMTREVAAEKMHKPLFYAAMMLHLDRADGFIAGAATATAEVMHAGLQIVRTKPGVSAVSAVYMMNLPNKDVGADGLLLCADCSITPSPSEEQLADIAISTAETAKNLCGIEPNVALLSFSTKGSTPHAMAEKIANATKLAQERAPQFNIDGELQADAALDLKVGQKKCPGSPVAGRANVLIFPDLNAANISYKLIWRLMNADAYGPLSQGFTRPVNDLSRGCDVEEIYNLIAMTAVQAQADVPEK